MVRLLRSLFNVSFRGCNARHVVHRVTVLSKRRAIRVVSRDRPYSVAVQEIPSRPLFVCTQREVMFLLIPILLTRRAHRLPSDQVTLRRYFVQGRPPMRVEVVVGRPLRTQPRRFIAQLLSLLPSRRVGAFAWAICVRMLVIVLFTNGRLVPFVRGRLLNPNPLSSRREDVLRRASVVIGVRFHRFVPLFRDATRLLRMLRRYRVQRVFQEVRDLPLQDMTKVVFLREEYNAPVMRRRFLFRFTLARRPITRVLLMYFRYPVFRFLEVSRLRVSRPCVPNSLFNARLPFHSGRSCVNL